MIKILFIIGLIFLCLNVLRFLTGNFILLRDKTKPLAARIWNVIETVGISVVLIILIVSYYN